MKESGAITDIIEPIGRVGYPEEVGSAVLGFTLMGAGYGYWSINSS
ncbi:hypothetical protein KBX40_03260 [Liquorilactobacillus satsumensis]|nr:hypothetical protein [Liquorilactobacillus satsumensis]